MEEYMININYKYFKKYVLNVNKNIDIDIFLLSYNTDSKDKIIELYKPIKSKFMKPKMDFDFFNHEKYNIYSDEDKNYYNKCIISRFYGLFKLGRMLKKYVESNNIKYDNVILSNLILHFRKIKYKYAY